MDRVTSQRAPQRTVSPSGRTILVALCAVGFAALVTSIVDIALTQRAMPIRLQVLAMPMAMGASGILIALFARRLKDSRDRRRWYLVCLSAIVLAVAAGAWVALKPIYGIVTGAAPVNNALFFAQYAVLLIVMTQVFWDARMARQREFFVLSGLGASVLAASLVWVLALERMGAEMSLATLMKPGVAMIMGEFALILWPCASLFSALLHHEDARFARGWLVFCVAVMVLVATDVVWALRMMQGSLETGSLADFSWIAVYGIMAAGASSALDAQEQTEQAEVEEARFPEQLSLDVQI